VGPAVYTSKTGWTTHRRRHALRQIINAIAGCIRTNRIIPRRTKRRAIIKVAPEINRRRRARITRRRLVTPVTLFILRIEVADEQAVTLREDLGIGTGRRDL
jgi:hypothetical protein